MFVRPALLLLSLAFAQADEEIVTGTVITGCDERVFHPPGRSERFEGIWYRWIDDSGFVPCASAAECARFIERDSLEFELTEEALDQVDALQRRFPEYYGVYRIRFIGRRGALTQRNCI